MRRIQLYLDEDLDEALSVAAARLHVSRSALVRDAIRDSLQRDLEALSDPVDGLIGWLDIDPDEDLDSVIYDLDS